MAFPAGGGRSTILIDFLPQQVPVVRILYLMASPVRVPALYIVTSRRTSSSLSYGYGFSCKSSSLLLWLLAVRVPVLRYYCDFPLWEFQSFGINVTSRCASSSLWIQPLAVRVPVVQYDLSLCEFQSLSLSLPQEYSVRRLYYWPLSQEYSAKDFIIWPLPQELCQRSSRMAI